MHIKNIPTIFTPQCLSLLFSNAIKEESFLMDTENINYLENYLNENLSANQKSLNECGLIGTTYNPEIDSQTSNKTKNNDNLKSSNFINISSILGFFNLSQIQSTFFSTCLLPLFTKLDFSVKEKGELDPKLTNKNPTDRKWRKYSLSKGELFSINDNSVPFSQYLVNNDNDSDAPNPTNIKFIDQYQSENLDNFYKACQKHRDQYRDPQGRLHPLDSFAQEKVAYQCPADITSTYLKYPTYYTSYRQPIVLPRTFERSFGFVPLPERVLRGRYMKYSDFTYKR